jgi:hypothetical protein
MMTFSGKSAIGSSMMSPVIIILALDQSDDPNSGTGTYLWFSERALASLQSGRVDRRCAAIKAPELVTPTGKFNVFNTLNDVY